MKEKENSWILTVLEPSSHVRSDLFRSSDNLWKSHGVTHPLIPFFVLGEGRTPEVAYLKQWLENKPLQFGVPELLDYQLYCPLISGNRLESLWRNSSLSEPLGPPGLFLPGLPLGKDCDSLDLDLEGVAPGAPYQVNKAVFYTMELFSSSNNESLYFWTLRDKRVVKIGSEVK